MATGAQLGTGATYKARAASGGAVLSTSWVLHTGSVHQYTSDTFFQSESSLSGFITQKLSWFLDDGQTYCG